MGLTIQSLTISYRLLKATRRCEWIPQTYERHAAHGGKLILQEEGEEGRTNIRVGESSLSEGCRTSRLRARWILVETRI
jgi:hypothetical protein